VDLEELERRLQERLEWEALRGNPLYVPLDQEDPPRIDLGDLRARYESSPARRLAGRDGEPFLLDRDRRMVALLVKPTGRSTDLDFARRFVGELESFLAGQDLSHYGPGFKVGLTGAFKKKVDQQRQIVDDVATASTLAALLILLYLAFHFRGLLPVLLVLAPVGVGLGWTYGLVAVLWGEVNC
jgi:predicted RND superfamily exporter protein